MFMNLKVSTKLIVLVLIPSFDTNHNPKVLNFQKQQKP